AGSTATPSTTGTTAGAESTQIGREKSPKLVIYTIKLGEANSYVLQGGDKCHRANPDTAEFYNDNNRNKTFVVYFNGPKLGEGLRPRSPFNPDIDSLVIGPQKRMKLIVRWGDKSPDSTFYITARPPIVAGIGLMTPPGITVCD